MSGPTGPTRPVTIVPMRRRHLRGVLRIERHSVHARWSTGLFLNELAGTNRCYVVALDDAARSTTRAVVGFAGLLCTGPDAHVTTIAVHPDARRAHIGTRLLLVLATEARRRGAEAMTLEVAASNAAAVALYERFGFQVEGVRAGYYAELGEDALVLWMSDLAGDVAGRRLAAIAAGLDPALHTEELIG